MSHSATNSHHHSSPQTHPSASLTITITLLGGGDVPIRRASVIQPLVSGTQTEVLDSGHLGHQSSISKVSESCQFRKMDYQITLKLRECYTYVWIWEATLRHRHPPPPDVRTQDTFGPGQIYGNLLEIGHQNSVSSRGLQTQFAPNTWLVRDRLASSSVDHSKKFLASLPAPPFLLPQRCSHSSCEITQLFS